MGRAGGWQSDLATPSQAALASFRKVQGDDDDDDDDDDDADVLMLLWEGYGAGVFAGWLLGRSLSEAI